MKRIVAFILVAIMALALVACAPKTDAPAADAPAQDKPADAPAADAPAADEGGLPFEGRKLTISYSSSENNDAYQAQFDKFSELTGAEIEVEILSADSNEANNTIYLRAATGAMTDITKMTIGSMIENIDPENNIEDLAGYDFVNNITEGFIESATNHDGRLWATPANTANVAGIFFNKKVVEELGLPEPKTWDEFLANCKWIRENTDKDPVSNPYDGTAGKQIIFLSAIYYIRQEDPEFCEKYARQEASFATNAAAMRALQHYYDLAELGYQNAEPLATSLEDSARALAEGTAVYCICRTNIMSNVENVVPEARNDFGFIPVPDIDPNNRGVATWMPTGWILSKSCQDKELALALLEWLTTAEAAEAFCEGITPTGGFMLKDAKFPEDVAPAVIEAQEWASKSSSPVLDYLIPFRGVNLPDLLVLCGTGDEKPEVVAQLIDEDFALTARQNGYFQ